jgi:hypothetical protein
VSASTTTHPPSSASSQAATKAPKIDKDAPEAPVIIDQRKPATTTTGSAPSDEGGSNTSGGPRTINVAPRPSTVAYASRDLKEDPQVRKVKFADDNADAE